jgi:hypothetical protein
MSKTPYHFPISHPRSLRLAFQRMPQTDHLAQLLSRAETRLVSRFHFRLIMTHVAIAKFFVSFHTIHLDAAHAYWLGACDDLNRVSCVHLHRLRLLSDPWSVTAISSQLSCSLPKQHLLSWTNNPLTGTASYGFSSAATPSRHVIYSPAQSESFFPPTSKTPCETSFPPIGSSTVCDSYSRIVNRVEAYNGVLGGNTSLKRTTSPNEDRSNIIDLADAFNLAGQDLYTGVIPQTSSGNTRRTKKAVARWKTFEEELTISMLEAMNARDAAGRVVSRPPPANYNKKRGLWKHTRWFRRTRRWATGL